MRFQIKKRFVLILILSVAQLACLSWGVLWFDHWLQGSIRTTMTKQVLDDNIETARQMTRLIEETGIGDVASNLRSWNRLQSIIKDIRLPNEGFVCIARNEDGQVICHPKLNSHPLLPSEGDETDPAGITKEELMTKQEMMAKQELRAADDSVDAMAEKKAMMMKQAQMAKQETDMTPKEAMMKSQTSEVSGGEYTIDGQVQIVAAATMPEMDAKVMVHQMASGIEAAINRISMPLRTIGMVVASVLAILSLFVNAFFLRRYESKLAILNEELETLNGGLEDLVQDRTRSLMNTRNAVIFGLAKLAESRDSDTGEHLERIRLYVVELAKQISLFDNSLTSNYIEDLGLASSLHDIGKVGIPDQVLLKPGRLDTTERDVIEHHPMIGGDCLRAISGQLGADDFLEISREIAYGHHERWDGKGYPANVAGEEIPLSARIVALADVYDALRSKRPYKDPMSHSNALEIILEGSGSHFDPMVVDAFLACEQKFEEISERYQGTVDEQEDSQVLVARLTDMLHEESQEPAGV